MNSNPRGAVLVCTKPALASKTPMYGSGATVACACRCSSIAFQVAFARFLTSAQTKVKTVQTLTMRLFFIFLMVCNRLFMPGLACSNPRTCRWPCKPQSKLVRLWQLLFLLAATNHTSNLFPLLRLLLLMCGCGWCPWSLAARAFQVHATIVAKLGIGQQSAAYRSNRSLPTQLPIAPTNKRASFNAIKANSLMHS